MITPLVTSGTEEEIKVGPRLVQVGFRLVNVGSGWTKVGPRLGQGWVGLGSGLTYSDLTHLMAHLITIVHYITEV